MRTGQYWPETGTGAGHRVCWEGGGGLGGGGENKGVGGRFEGLCGMY